jgi:protocatechuate 3,4-dioxygenase beta subunit
MFTVHPNAHGLKRGRRGFLQGITAGAAMLAVPGVLAAELTRTAPVAEGPFYPDKLPLDTDNDLLIINEAITPAVGEITYLSGRVLSTAGLPIRNAFVEIWQVDNHGAYLHSGTSNREKRDKNFQGYGRFLTDSKGQYAFRTIKPVPYPGRTPHIHFGVSKNGRRIFTTQMLIRGEPQNERDGLFRAIRDPQARETILVDFRPLENSQLGELTAQFDIVLGQTVEELEDGTLKGGIGRSMREQGRG